MRYKCFSPEPTARRFVIVAQTGDDAFEQLAAFARNEQIVSAQFSGVGGFERAVLAYYNIQSKAYEHIRVDEQVEVLSINGNIARYKGDLRVHAHCVVGHRDGHTTGGHLLEAIVRPTLELMLEELADAIERKDNAEAGIPLIEL